MSTIVVIGLSIIFVGVLFYALREITSIKV